jgi:putative transposase
MADFIRKRNRLPAPAYVGPRWYFVTLCTGERRPYFLDGRLVGDLLKTLQDGSSFHHFGVYAYCFMPDHLHLELAGLSEHTTLPALIRDFKGRSVAQAPKMGIRRLWQKSYYDHILREEDSENAVAWYIFNNPVRKGLVNEPRQWPFSGSWMFDWVKAVAPPEEFRPPWKMPAAG